MSDADNNNAVVYKTSAHLFVSTSLDIWATEHPEWFARDFQINDTIYRRLDPEYYAWLRSRMQKAKQVAAAGQLDEAAFHELREKFNAVHHWAITHFGEDSLREAVCNLDARKYIPPATEKNKPVRAVRAVRHFAAEVVAMVDAIRDQALSLGWTQESLYGAGGTMCSLFGKACGLAGMLKPTHRIGEITRQSIEIILPHGVRQHFYNPDVEQPWIQHVRSE